MYIGLHQADSDVVDRRNRQLRSR